MSDSIAWLLGSEPYIRYRTMLDLQERSPEDSEVLHARTEMLAMPLVKSLLADLYSWPGDTITNHKKATLHYHKLAFLADIGVQADDPGMQDSIGRILEHVSDQGVLELPLNIPIVFGGTGNDQWSWVLCDTPRLYASLLKMGVPQATLQQGLDVLSSLVRDNGFPCAGSPRNGRFRGPGKQSDPCPYATLMMISALLQVGDAYSAELGTAAEGLLTLWQHSREHAPYLFKTGTDFRKLKAPFVWYDILHVADALSQINRVKTDPRFLEMIDIIRDKANSDGLYTPESIWMAWKGWDFAQKKQPSPWITFLVLRIFKRIGVHA